MEISSSSSSSSGGRRLEGYDTGALRGYDVLEGVLATAPTATRDVSSTASLTARCAGEVTHRGGEAEDAPDTAPITISPVTSRYEPSAG